MEPQETPNNQRTLEKKEQSKSNMPWHQTILQSYNNQNSMVLAQKQGHRSTEKSREPINNPMHL